MRSVRLTPLAVFVGVVLVLLPDLGGQNVWSKDEARDGLVAREMVQGGHWLIPHIGGQVYPYKPPLFHWLVALASPRGVTEWSLRFPSVVAAAGTAAVTCSLAARLASPAAGVVAAMMLVSSATFVEWARTGRLEMLLVFWVTLGFWSATCWLDTGRRRHAIALGIALGFGCLTKGPVGLIPLLVAVVARGLLRGWSRRALGDVALSLALALLVPLGWLALAAARREGLEGYVEAVLAVAADEVRASRGQHALYAAEVIGIGFLPWTILLPGALVVIARAWREAWRRLLVPLLWIGAILGVFTLLISPRAVHFLPLYPALATLVAWAWSTCSARARRGMSVPMMLAVLALVGFGLAVAFVPMSFAAHRRVVEIGARLGLALAGIGVITALAMAVALRRGRPNQMAMMAAGGALVVALVIHVGVVTPLVNRAYGTRETAARLDAALPRDAQIVYLDRKFATGLMFYLPHRTLEIAGVGALRDVAARPGFYALVPGAEMAHLSQALCVPARALREASVVDDRYVLIDFHGTQVPWCAWPPGS
jgi:4-amino-4-deoxy-L-arabinose transferase-like glycosyltransferase